MLHHSHRAPMRQALALIFVMALGLSLAWTVPLWAGFRHIEDYMPVHTLLEMVSVVIAVLVFASGWNAYSRVLPRHAVILACTFLGVAVLDFMHALSFTGMPHFITPAGPQKAIHFWLAARLMAASALLAVALLPPRSVSSGRARYGWLLAVSLVVAACLNVFLFHPEWVPTTYRDGTGLTAFKIAAEYVIVGMNVVAAACLYRQMRHPLPFNAAALFGAVGAMALSECFFTLYGAQGDIYHVMGHLYKVVAYLFLYRAVFVEVIEAPYREMARMGDQLRATLDAVPDVMLEVDLHGRYHAVHSSRPEKLIRPIDELLKLTIQDVMAPEQAQVIMAEMNNALMRGTSFGAQLELDLPQGRRWFELSVSRKGSVQGLDTRFIVLSRDITERKLAEAALLERQAMMKASQAKSEFLSRVSHELRTPLNAVIGFAQLLLHDANSRMQAGQRVHVEYILRAGQHLLEMINDILDLTRIESGDADLAMAPVRIDQLISQSLPMVLPQAEAMGVAVHADARAVEGREVLGDERRLKQVLINVLSNAVKYNRVGGKVTVLCDIHEDERQGERLLLRVLDTGRGLNATQMKGLFEPFNRLGADRDGIEGTGLGLVITRRLVESMGGEITLYSTEGMGTTVNMRMPLLARTNARPSALPPLAAALPNQGEGGKLTVLCIEDNPLNVALLKAIFDLRPDVSLLIAEDGSQGLDKVQRSGPDLVLVDINLPDMNGDEVLLRIRQMPQGQGLVCIAMSADVSGDPLSRAHTHGFADFWPKPLDVGSVLMRLDAVLASIRSEQARGRHGSAMALSQ